MYFEEYVTEEKMKELLLYKRVVEATEDLITLENGVTLSIECTEYDCCAGGGGFFVMNGVPLDAVITDVEVGEASTWDDGDTRITGNSITLYHNQNDIIKAEATTDAGNGGYYYSVTSLRIGEVYFPFAEA